MSHCCACAGACCHTGDAQYCTKHAPKENGLGINWPGTISYRKPGIRITKEIFVKAVRAQVPDMTIKELDELWFEMCTMQLSD